MLAGPRQHWKTTTHWGLRSVRQESSLPLPFPPPLPGRSTSLGRPTAAAAIAAAPAESCKASPPAPAVCRPRRLCNRQLSRGLAHGAAVGLQDHLQSAAAVQRGCGGRGARGGRLCAVPKCGKGAFFPFQNPYQPHTPPKPQAEILRQLGGHPHIAGLRAAYEDRHAVHFVIEYCSGEPLHASVNRRAPSMRLLACPHTTAPADPAWPRSCPQSRRRAVRAHHQQGRVFGGAGSQLLPPNGGGEGRGRARALQLACGPPGRSVNGGPGPAESRGGAAMLTRGVAGGGALPPARRHPSRHQAGGALQPGHCPPRSLLARLRCCLRATPAPALNL